MAGTGIVQASNRLLQVELRRLEVERARGDARLRRFHLREHSFDVDAAVGRGERRQPPRCFLELASRGDGTAAAGLVPGDRDMDETLEEISLLRGRRAPRLFELLVRLEVATGPNLLQPTLERSLHYF